MTPYQLFLEKAPTLLVLFLLAASITGCGAGSSVTLYKFLGQSLFGFVCLLELYVWFSCATKSRGDDDGGPYGRP